MGSKRRVARLEEALARQGRGRLRDRSWGEDPPPVPEGASSLAVARHEFAAALARVERRYPDEGRGRRVVFPKDMSPECHRAMSGDPKVRAAATEVLRQIGIQNRHKVSR